MDCCHRQFRTWLFSSATGQQEENHCCLESDFLLRIDMIRLGAPKLIFLGMNLKSTNLGTSFTSANDFIATPRFMFGEITGWIYVHQGQRLLGTILEFYLPCSLVTKLFTISSKGPNLFSHLYCIDNVILQVEMSLPCFSKSFKIIFIFNSFIEI